MEDYKSKYDNYDIGQRLSDLKNVVEIQEKCIDDEYMRGMYNGLILAWSIIREPYGKDVPFKEAPKK